MFKESKGEGQAIATGIRSAESNARSKRKQVEPCFNAKKGYMFVHPIINWSDSDVWNYIRERNIPHSSLYNEGFKRLGCIGCPMIGKGRGKEAIRWPKIWRAWKRACYKRWEDRKDAPNKRGMFKGRTYRDKWPTAEHYWKWWLEEGDKEDENQMGMFT